MFQLKILKKKKLKELKLLDVQEEKFTINNRSKAEEEHQNNQNANLNDIPEEFKDHVKKRFQLTSGNCEFEPMMLSGKNTNILVLGSKEKKSINE